MTIAKRKRIASRRPGPTTNNVIPIWSEWIDEFGVRRAICGEDCPVCGKTLRGSALFPPEEFREFDHENMIYCIECGSRFRIRKYWEN